MKIDDLERILENIQNRYEAIRVIAKEARRVNLILRRSEEELEEKPTTIAVQRAVEGKVKYRYEPKEGQQ
jgi:DNA-directed RNA polymerase subunit K/omega